MKRIKYPWRERPFNTNTNPATSIAIMRSYTVYSVDEAATKTGMWNTFYGDVNNAQLRLASQALTNVGKA
ncbi:MAG: hypothetical protein WC734_06115 [Patescibacteria group bacterium]